MRNLLKLLLLTLIFGATTGYANSNINFSTNLIEKNYKIKPEVNPSINVNSSNLNQFTACLGSASQSQSFTVSGTDLNSDIVITAPTGYEISNDGGATWQNSITLTETSGNVNNTTILIRISASTNVGQHNGTVFISSGLTNENITGISGDVYNTPNITGTLNTCVGSTSNLNAQNNGTWSSSNTGVASVSSTGDVLGISAGTTTITYTKNGCSDSVLFTVHSLPTISGSSSVCIGSTLQLTGSGTAASTNPWVSTNNTVATISSNGLITGASAGTTTITYTNSDGCSDSVLFTVYSLPTISGNSNVSICIGSTLQLTGSGTAASANPWVSSNSSVATISNTGLITSVSAGTTTITYTNSHGCEQTKNITINSLPIVDFTYSNSICSGIATQFFSTVSGNGNFQYSWSFGNSTSANTANPTTTFSTFGCGITNYNVTLTVTDSNGCQSSATHSINVNQQPEGDFFDTNPLVDPNDPLSFFNNCNDASASNPTFNVTLGLNPSITSVCGSYVVDWGDSTSQTYSNVTTATQLNHTYLLLGTYNITITMIGTNGCQTIKTYFVKNISNPSGGIVSPGSTINLCMPTANLNFGISGWQNNSPNTQYSINWGDGTISPSISQEDIVSYMGTNINANYPVSHIYTSSSCAPPFNSPTGFTVTLSISNACGTTISTVNNVTTITKPIPTFTAPSPVCNGTNVFFTNTSTLGYGNNCNKITTWIWNFGDPASGTNNTITTTTNNSIPNVNHIFSGPGCYTVTLTANNSCTLSPNQPLIASQQVIVLPAPIASFTIPNYNSEPVCYPYSVTLNNTSNTITQCDPSFAQYLWQVTYLPAYCGTTANYSPLTSTATNPTFQFNAAGQYKITLKVTNNICGTNTSAEQIITIKQPPTVSINTISDYCATASINPTAIINSCSNITTNNPTYLWSFPGSNTPTSTALNPTNIQYTTPGTYTVTLEVTNECGTTIATKSFTIFETSVGGTASANQTICSGTTPNPLTLTGQTGTIQWQTAASASGPWTNIAGATSATLTLAALTSTKYYQAVVTSGACPAATSNMITITVNPVSVGGTASANQTICSGATPNALTLAGYTGTIQWQSAPALTGPWTNIAGETNATLVLGSLSASTFYQAIVTSGVCPSATSTKVTITVSQPSVSGTASADQTICSGTTPNPLTLTGQTGTIQWQTAASASGPWTNIAGATSATLTLAALTSTKYYQAVVTSGACPAATSNMITITVNPVSVGGTASANQTICSGATPNALTLAGYTGTIQWQSAPALTGPWTNIAGETNATLVLGSLSASTFYQAIVTSGVCPSATSTKVTITVSQPSVSGTASADQTICSGTTPNPLTLTGQTGTIQWQTAASASGPWTNIAGATSATLTLAALTSTKYYQAVVTSGACPAATSNMITITVNPVSVGGTASANQTICSGATPNALTLAGYTGTIQWQSAPALTGPWTNIAGETNATLVLGSLSASTFYQAIVTSGVCPSATSTKVTITVSQPSVSGTASADQTICSGTTPNPLTLTGQTGTIQWQTATSASGPWTNIAGATSATLTLAALTSTKYYQAVVTSGACPAATSNMITITVNPISVGGTASSNQTICSGATPNALTLAGYTGTIQWQSAPASSGPWTNITGQTNATLVLGSLSATTFYQAVVTSGVCIAAFSTKVTITVNPLPTISGNSTICIGTTTQLTGSVNATATPWSSSNPGVATVSNSGLVTGISAGSTVITYTNTNGCQNTITITVNPLPTISGTLFACTGSTTQLTGSGSPSTTNPWTSSSPLVASISNSGLVTANTAGTSTITYTNINGCSITALITVNPLGQVNTISDESLCHGGNLLINFTTNTVTGTTTYNWTSTQNPSIGINPSGNGDISFTASYTGAGIGTSTVIVTPTYTNGGVACPGPSSQFTISVYPPPTISVQPTPTQNICIGGTVPAFTVAYINGYGTPDYQWFYNTSPTITGATVLSGAINPTYTPPSFLAPGTYYYFAKICLNGLGCGCVYSNIAEVIVYGDPNATITPLTQTICQNTPPTPVVVTANGGINGNYTYLWYTNVAPNNIGATVLNPIQTSSTFIPPTNLVGTNYYYCVVNGGLNCDYETPVVQVVTVAAPIAHTQPLATQTVCINGTPTTLSVDFINGTGTPTYQWYSNTVANTATGTAIAGATALNYTPPTSATGTLYYYCIATYNTGGCTTATSNIAEVIVNPIQTITTQPLASQDICVSGTIAPLSVAYTGGVGTASYQWYSNTNNLNSGGLAISGATAASYTPPTFNSIGDFYFYATVTLSGSGCNTVPSNTALVHVVADPTVTITPTSQTICQNTTPTNLVVTPSGGIGTYSYQWYNSPSATLIAGATSATYTPATTTVGTLSYYCVITQTGLGCSVTSPVVSVQVVAAPAVNTQPLATQTVCLNGAPTALAITLINGTGTPTYQWYSNTVADTATGTAIAGATALNYTPPTSATGTLYYFCIATYSNGGCGSTTSNIAEVIVNPIQTITTQPLASQDICVSGTIAPLSVAYTGGVGTASYQWYSNTNNLNSGGLAISGATAASYTPPTFNSIGDFYFYATVTLSGSGCNTVPSNTALVHVVADPTVTITPTSQTICQNTTPTNLVVTPSGGIGTYSYQWYNSPSATLIAGATSATYTPATTTVGTLSYYCVITQTGLGCSVTSPVVSVQVVAAPAVNTQPLATQTVCLNGAPTALAITLINGTGTPTYQWYSNTVANTATGTAIAGATALNYTPPTSATGTLYYYCIATYSNGGCGSTTSNIAEVIVNPIQTITTQPLASQDICVSGTIAPLSVAYTGGVGTASYQWYSNTNNLNSGGLAISGATAASYTPPTFNSIGDFYFYATVTLSGSGCNTVPSNTALVHVVADPTVTITPTSQTICQNTTPTNLVVTPSGGIGTYSYQWYNSPSATLIAGATSATYTPATTTVGTLSYYCVITQTGLGCSVTSPVVSVQVVAAPAVNTQPLATQTVCLNGAPTALAITLINGTGTPTYQWYSNTVANTATGTAIAGATALNYTPPTSATGTLYYYCIATYSNGGCGSTTSNIAEVIVNPIQTITTQPLASQDICVSGTIAPLSVAYTGGVGTASYQWYSNTNNLNSGGLAISGATAASYTPPTFNSIGDFYFYATVTLSGSGCNTVPSNTALVHVVADPTVTITPTSQTICQNTTPTNLVVTPSGGIGTYSYQWYNSPSATLIAGATSATYTPATTTVGTLSYYCVITQTGLGCSVTSPVVSVQVVAAPAVNTQPLATQTVCLNGAPTALAITLINGTGTPTYQWYSNTVANTATGTAIAGATALNYTPPTSATGTLYYYCIATYSNGGCGSTTSNIAEVIVNPIQTITTQPLASQDICVSGTIAPLSVAYTGGVGTASYQWYSNTNNLNSGGLAISGATAASYTPPTFNSIGDFYFYATVTLSGSGCNTVPSNTALVHVVADPTVTITPTSQTICQNTTPTNLVVTPSGGIGTYSYQWYNSPSATLIAGATSATYTPATTTVGTLSYYCVITQTGLGCSVTSPVVSVQVVAAPAVNTQPLATQTVCLNGAPTALAITLINGTGTPTYQWYSNTVADTATGTAITGATALNYTPPTSATGTLYYYCIATYNTGGCTTATSNIAEVIVNPIQTISTQPLASQDICVSGTIAPLSVAYTGGVGTASYQWYSNANNLNSGGLAISGATAASYTPPTFNSIGDFYFYATVTLSGSGCNTVPSNTALVHVVADPTVTITPTSQTICQNTTPTNLVVTPSGGIGTYSYQWYNSPSATLIAGATSATYTPATTTVGTLSYYCVITQTGLGCSVTSPVVSVQVVAAPAVNTQPLATQTVCLNGAPTALAITLINGTGTPTYQWYSNTVADTATGTAITGATALNYTPPTSATGTLYYYCIATYNTGGCTTATSNIAEVIVNPIQTISTQPLASQDICVSGTIAPLSVAYTGGVGTASYQWYSNTNNLNSGGLAISGATAASYTPPTFNSIGDFYFYATVTLSGSGCNTVPSNTALVHVVADPTVTITPTSQTICQNTTPTNLVVTPSDGIGTYSYQWYSNTTSNTSTGTLIPGETNATTTPINSIVGTTYYYCVITQTGLGCSVTSNASQVTIVAVPTISVQPISNQVVCQNDPTTTLDITVVNGTGIPNYQWYSNTVNSLTGSTAIVGANGPSYIPSSSIPSTTYYYCIIQYASGNCGSLTSNISEVITNSIAFIPNKTATICSGDLYTFNPTGSVLPEIVPTGTQYTWFVDPMPSPLVTGASDNLGLPLASISQNINNNDTVPHTIVYHVTPITGNCQGAPFTISVTINPKVIPNEIIGNVQCNSFPPLCNGSITLNPTPTGNGVFSYLWSIPGTTTSQINLCPGNYTVDITDSYSCTYNFPYTVTVPPAMISVPTVNPVNNTNCDVPASCNGIIQVVISGGTPFASTTNPYQFQWFEVIGGTNIPITNSLTQVNTSILQNLCGGTYLLVVTDSVNCQRQFGPYTITNPSSLVVTSTVSNYNGFEVSCNGGNNGIIGINVTGGISSGISITLNPGNITLPNPATFTGLTAGSYTAVIHDSMNNCPDIIRNFVLTQPAAPVTATLNVVSPAQCFGNQAIYEAIPSGGTGGYTYLWSNGVTTPVVSNIPSGAFTCIIKDSNGCQFTLNGVNNSPPLLVASAVVTSPILCFGGTATISVSATGGTPGYSGDIGTHTGVPAGSSPIYTITDSNGCQATVSIAVAQPPYLQVSAVIAIPVSCFGGTATVTVSATGGTPGYIGTGTIPLPGGNNTITVTDANGCTNSAQIYIPQPPQLVATASLTSPILCNGSTGIITISGTGGTPFGTAPFYTGTGPITVTAGTGIYSISDANGCTALTAPFTVNEPTPVVATAIITSPILCHGGSAIVSVNATGGVVGITGYTGTGNFVVPAGTYTYLVKDSNNCISTVTITVTQPPLLVATATVTSPILCFGGTATVLVTAAGGTIGTAGYFGAIGNHTVTAGTYTYNVIDANGCVATTSITVTQPGLLGFTIKSVTNPNCFPNRLYDNGSICIKILGGTAPFPVGTGWVQSTTIPNEWCLSGLTAGSYTISVADINNCPSTSQTITLTQPTPLTATVSSNINVNCSIKEVSQTNIVLASGGIPGYSYSWSGGDSCLPVNPQCMTTTVNGNYTAFVNDQEGLTLGCIPIQAPITINLPSIGNPLMSITSYSGTTCGNFAVDDPITLTNISTGDYTSIQWLTDGIPRGNTNSIIHNFSTIGDHTITLIVNYTIGGVTCTYSISEVISITKGYDMVVPNAFTPGNNDNINDTIKPEFNCMSNVEMRVYDTWGSLLYVEAGATLIGWDGKINGRESENGNYIIVVKATTLFGAEINYNGPFTLLK